MRALCSPLRMLALSLALLHFRRSMADESVQKVLAPGSQLRLSSSTDSSLNTIVGIDWDGDAHVPLCGKIKLRGLRVETAREVLRACLSRFFKKAPELSLEEMLPRLFAVKIGLRGQNLRVVNVSAQMSVRSLVAREGFQLPPGSTIRLLSPYGFDVVYRHGDKLWSEAFQWRGGETVVFDPEEASTSEASFDVLGEVRKPGKYSYRPARTVMEVLREVQGPTPQAAFDSIVIYRQTDGRKIETHWDDSFHKIEPGDVLLVPAQKEGGIDKTLRWTSSLLAIVNTFFLILLARK